MILWNDLSKKLLAWKNSPYRKPLILKGVRQVGKVNFMQIDPMTFNEFLLANGDENLAQYLEQVDTIEPIPDAFLIPCSLNLKSLEANEMNQYWCRGYYVDTVEPSRRTLTKDP